MTYTGRNLLASKTEAPGSTSAATETYTYNLDGTLDTRTDPRGNLWTTIWKNCCRRVQAQLDPLADVDGSGTNKRGVTVTNYDGDGEVTHTARVSDASTGYDNEDRLVAWSRTAGSITSQSWNLSLVGDWNINTVNSTPETRSHNAVHELTQINPTTGPTLSYDLKGNETQDDKGRTFMWDFDNHLASANCSATGGAANLAFTYDGLGRRVSKFDGTTTMVYVSDGQQELTEYHAGDNPASVAPQQTYAYGTYIDEPLANIDSANSELFYHANRLHSVLAMTDSTGEVVERYIYSAYGTTTIVAPDGVAVRTRSAVGNPYMYTGRRLDSEFGSNSNIADYYFRARYYDSCQGRFIGRDPARYISGMSMYEYANDKVNRFTDPSGLCNVGDCNVTVLGVNEDGPYKFNYVPFGSSWATSLPVRAVGMAGSYYLISEGLGGLARLGRSLPTLQAAQTGLMTGVTVTQGFDVQYNVTKCECTCYGFFHVLGAIPWYGCVHSDWTDPQAETTPFSITVAEPFENDQLITVNIPMPKDEVISEAIQKARTEIASISSSVAQLIAKKAGCGT